MTYQTNRAFSASRVNQISLVDIAVAGPSAVLDIIHSVGIPWHTTLPLTAILVRTTFVYYLSTGPSRRRQEIKSQLVPLISAHVTLALNSKAEREIRRHDARAKMPALLQSFKSERKKLWYRIKAMRRLANEHGAKTTFPGQGLLNFVTLVAFAEAIRLKCGARDGLLPLILSPFEWFRERVTGDASLTSEARNRALAKDPTNVTTTGTGAHREVSDVPLSTQDAQTMTVLSPVEDVSAFKAVSEQEELARIARTVDESSPYFDPSMQTEGFGFFANLTLPDPSSVLPLALMATMMVSTALRPSVTTSKAPESRDVRLTLGQRFGILVACLFGFVATNMPAAILLYFIPSILTGWVQQRYLDWKRPIQPPIRPCKRLLRVKVTKGY